MPFGGEIKVALQIAIMAAPDRAVKARNHEIERCQTVDEAAPAAEGSLSGVISRLDGAA